MSIYYYGKLVSVHDLQNQKSAEPMLVGDIIKQRDDYQTYTNRNQKTKFVIRHYQDA